MANKKIFYLDIASTTHLYRGVAKEMNKYYFQEFGNPSSQHELGEKALEAINEARRKLAEEINAKPFEIIFTSGSTESNNLAFFGLAKSHKNKKKIIISTIEHSSILEVCNVLKKEGFFIKEIPVNKKGILDINQLEKEIDKNTLLVSIMHVNNEIGVIQDIENIGKLCYGKEIYFHTDAAQSFGKLKIDVSKMNISLLSAGAHKIGGPKGIGFLYIKKGIKIPPLIYGGGQENRLRGGTENVPAILGFAKALEISKKIDKNKIQKLRDYLIQELERLGGKINGDKEKRIYNNINVSFPIDAENLVAFLSHKGIYVSAGSACDTKRKKESKVLKEIGLNEKEIKGSIRISLNENIIKKDIHYVISIIKNSINRLKILK